MSRALKAGKEWTVPSELSFQWLGSCPAGSVCIGLRLSLGNGHRQSVPTSKTPWIRPESLTAHGHQIQTEKGTRSNRELKTSACSAIPAQALFLLWLRAHVHCRPNKVAFHGSSWSGFSLGGLLGVKVTLFKLLSLLASGKGTANAVRGTVRLQGR